MKPTPKFGTKKDLQKEFQRLHQKMMDKKKGKPTPNLAVPQSRDTLLLKYGPGPLEKKQRTIIKSSDDIASYKRDAMKLIINRIYRYMGNIFHEMQRKVMNDDIMREQKDLYDLLNRPKRNLLRTQLQNNENDYNMINNPMKKDKTYNSQEKPNFREIFEMKKRKIKDNYDQLFNQEIFSDNIAANNEYLMYETPDKDDSMRNDKNFIQVENVQVQNNNIQQISLSANSFDSMKKQKPINNRYNSDSHSQDEDVFANNSKQVNVFQPQPYILREKAENSPIMEEDYSNEQSSIQRSPDISEIYQQQLQQQQEEIIKPAIKKDRVQSYLNKDFQISNKPKGMLIKSQKQQDMVDMSFSENPFDNRSQNQHFLHQNSIGRDHFNSTAKEDSPDFKRSIKMDSLQGSFQRQNSNLTQKTLKPNESVSSQKMFSFQNQSLELNLNKIESTKQLDQSKPKFTDQLKNLINDFEVKPNSQSNKQTIKENSSNVQTENNKEEETIQNDRIEKLQKMLSQQFNPIQQNNSQNSSKMQELKRKLGRNNQMAEFVSTNSLQSTQQENNNSVTQKQNLDLNEIQFTLTPLGKMYRLNDNEVLFEDSRIEKLATQTQLNQQQSVFKVKSKKPQQQQQQMQQPIVIQKNTDNIASANLDLQLKQEKKYQKFCNNISPTLKNLVNSQLKGIMVELMKHQIEKQKFQYLIQLKNKVYIKQAFKQLIINAKKRKSLDIITKFAKKQQNFMDKQVNKVFVLWKLGLEMEKQQQNIKRKEFLNGSINYLNQTIKHKIQQNQKYAFEQIKNYLQLLRKQEKEQSQKRSVQQIFAYLLKKEKKILNKKFQKMRKIMFLIAFDQKLVSLTKLLDLKISQNKTFAFKEMINHCIKNDPYKKAIERLNNEYNNQKIQIVEKQLNRMVKILTKQQCKLGFQKIKKQNQNYMERTKVVKRLGIIILKYQQEQKKQLMSYGLKQLIKNKENSIKLQQRKEQSCKKIKLFLKVQQNKQLKQFLETWKNETQNFINIEMTKLNNEKSLIRNSRLEQLFIDKWWDNLSWAFTNIKRYGHMKEMLGYLIQKQNKKKLKERRIKCFLSWKNKVYKMKLIKINLSVLVKGIDKRQNKKIQKLFQKWKFSANQQKVRNFKLFSVLESQQIRIENYYSRQVKSYFELWKQKNNYENIKIDTIKKLLKNKINKALSQNLDLWKKIAHQRTQFQQKAASIQDKMQKLYLKFKFKRFQNNARIRTMKLQAMDQIGQYLINKNHLLLQESFGMIAHKSNMIKTKQSNQKDAAKLIQRIIKIINFRSLQKTLLKWKLISCDQQAQSQKQMVQKQYQRRILTSIISKTLRKSQAFAFQELKQHSQKSQEIFLKTSLKLRSGILFAEKVHALYIHKMKSNFQSLHSYYLQRTKSSKVHYAISKLSSVNKIFDILEAWRSDRIYFYRWKNETLISQAYEYGFNILENLHQIKMEQYLNHMIQQSRVMQIIKIKQDKGLNILRMISQKQDQGQIQKFFINWQQVINQPKAQKISVLPPKAVKGKSSSLERSPNSTKVIDLNFNSNYVPTILFRKSSKNSSVNTSIVSQKNNRYSQQDEEENELYDTDKIYLDSQFNNRESDYIPILSGKMNQSNLRRESFGSKKSNRSSENKRYQLPKEDSFQDIIEVQNYQPFTTKNNPLQQSLLQFLKDEQFVEQQMRSREQSQQSQESYYGTQEGSKESIKSEKQKVSQKGNQQSRNKNGNLNKYLSGNSQVLKSDKSSQGTYEELPKFEEQKEFITIQQHQQQKNLSHKHQYEDQQDQKIQKKNEENVSTNSQVINITENQQKNQSLSQSRLFSPRSQMGELEPVPEEDHDFSVKNNNNQNKKKSRKEKSVANNKLSSFLNIRATSTTQQQPKQDQKSKKLKSKENNEKFKVFLAKNKGNNHSQSQIRDNNISIQNNSDQVMVQQQKRQNYSQHKQQYEFGIQVLEKFFMKKSLESIISSAFSNQNQQKYQKRVKNKQIQKIGRVLQIRAEMIKRDAYLKQEAFLTWKRSDYMMMLESLNAFKNTLNNLYKNNNKY